jgi:large subunit ribosomal protein L10
MMAEYETKLQQSKLDAVQALVNEFKDVNDFIFADYRGLTVEQITDLRNKLREQEAVFKVVKNRFAKIALGQLDKQETGDLLIGPTAVALPKGESGDVAKTLIEYAKNSKLELKGGIIDGNLFSPDQVIAYSKLPGRDQLLAQLMGTMKAPIQNMVFLLNGIPTKLVRTLQALADSKE